MKTWRTKKKLDNTRKQRPILCAKCRKQNINNLENSFNCSNLRILKCLEKQSLFCLELYCEYL